ncbi:MAG: two-component sensor histidine kinase [Comamonadaceae bacterium CG2_30_59_20]|nr:MAG: two-component sensor histidine kinase [Comamonadaceae bacterium CG2_30_59_20]
MSARGLRLRWQQLSVRHKLMALSLLPLLVVLPLLVAALVLWGSSAYDRLLITKVRSDLAVAHGYFGRVLAEVGTGTQALANAHTLHLALAAQDLLALHQELAQARQRLGFDFVNLYALDGQLLNASWLDAGQAPAPASQSAMAAPGIQLQRLSQTELLALAPHLAPRLNIALIPTQGAAPTTRSVEDQALVMLASHAVTDPQGRPLAWVRAGVLLNQNLDLIDHINQIVYPMDSLPLGSVGTATLFLDDVRVTTNVRLFLDQRAIGTRVSKAVRDAVLVRGETWLDRAFVVNDWYVSAYEPLLNGQGARIGMLYVGYLETPFRQTKYGILAIIVGIFAVAMVLAAWLSLRWARSIFQPVERMNHTMQQVQDGNAAARVGPLAQQDELGALAHHLDQLLVAVDDKTRTLQRWGQELDAKVTERTRALAESHESLKLTQAQLVKSEKLAAIGQLTASLAHEINNPIAVMQGNLDLMRETLGPQALPIAPELKLMDQQIERMRLIVTQLLQYARPNDYAGYVEAVDVNDALASSLVLVEHLLNRTHIHVQRRWQASHAVHINRQELQQVLINLMINAIQAMPEGGELLLRTADQTDAQHRTGVRIEVCDNGAGLSQANLAQVFSPFFTTKNDGNGLGLWISVGLVERYGGSIRAGNRRDWGEDSPGAVFAIDLLCEAADT